jgi:hypothetical protein
MLTRILARSSICLLATGLVAQTATAPLPDAKEADAAGRRMAAVEPFPNLGLLHRDDKAGVLNELWVLGRYHGQYHWSEGSNGDDDGWENRRFRLGTQMRLFDNLTLHAQSVSGSTDNTLDFGDFDPDYNGFTELWSGWRFHESFMLTVGQQKHRFTHDRNVSSRYINTLERSLLTNMFRADYTPAVTASGRFGAWSYYAGVFTNATGRDMGTAFTEFDSGQSVIGSITRDLGDSLGTDSAFLNVSAVSSDATAEATNLNYFDTGLASALILTRGSCSLVSEVTAGLGNRNGDAFGVNLQPGWFLTDKWQVVGRYQYARSDGDRGLRAQGRYERLAGMTTGDEYQAGYVGLNHFLAGYRVRMLYGVEYASLGGRDCWTAAVMFRFFFGPHSRGPFPMGDTLPGTFF